MSGWIKAHRKIMQNPTLRGKPDRFYLFMELLFSARHEPGRSEFAGKEIELEPGQFVTTIRRLAKETGLHQSKILRILIKLENRNMIERKIETEGTLVTICNWGIYQGGAKKIETPLGEKSKQDRNTIETPNKNVKKGKNEKGFGLGSRACAGSNGHAKKPGPEPKPEKFYMFGRWQMSREANERLEEKYLDDLGLPDFWRQVSRFVLHHCAENTEDTQAGFERSLDNWLKRANVNLERGTDG